MHAYVYRVHHLFVYRDGPGLCPRVIITADSEERVAQASPLGLAINMTTHIGPLRAGPVAVSCRHIALLEHEFPPGRERRKKLRHQRLVDFAAPCNISHEPQIRPGGMFRDLARR